MAEDPIGDQEPQGAVHGEESFWAAARRFAGGSGFLRGFTMPIREFGPGGSGPAYQRVEANLGRAKATVAAAWIESTDEVMPGDVQQVIQSATTAGELRRAVGIAMDRLGPGADAFFAAYVRLASSAATVGPVGEGVGYSKDAEGNFVNDVTGDILDTEQIQTQVGTAAENLIDAILGAAPEAGPTVTLELPFIGGLPDESTVAEDRPAFDPAGVFEPGIVPGEAPGQARGAREGRRDFKQRYRLGANWGPAGWDPARRTVTKDLLVRGGYLDPDDMTGGGTWAYAEASAMGALMEEANAIGITWESQAGRVASDPSEAAKRRARGTTGGRAPFVAPPYLKPDQATLSQAVKQAVRNKLGREPTARDMGDLIEQLGVDYRAEYAAQVAAARAQFDATTRALDTDTAQSSGTVQTVDPSARFAEHFESRFAPEIAFKDRREDLNQREAVGRATLNMVDSLIGGG
jgi:hypothetical protein